MKTFKKFLTECAELKEDAQSDAQARREASVAWDKLYKAMRDPSFWKKGILLPDANSIIFAMAAIDKSTEYKDLFISFSYSTGDGAAGLYSRATGTKTSFVIVKLLLPPPEGQELDNTYARKELARLSKDHWTREVFIHEFTHYLDSRRFGDEVWGKSGTMGHMQNQKWMLYFNDPKELNAFYQEGIDQIESRIDTLRKYYQKARQAKDKNDVQYVLLQLDMYIHPDFKMFWKWNMQEFPKFRQDYLEKLTDQNKKRIYSRIYSYYMDVLLPERNKMRAELEKRLSRIEGK